MVAKSSGRKARAVWRSVDRARIFLRGDQIDHRSACDTGSPVVKFEKKQKSSDLEAICALSRRFSLARQSAPQEAGCSCALFWLKSLRWTDWLRTVAPCVAATLIVNSCR